MNDIITEWRNRQEVTYLNIRTIEENLEQLIREVDKKFYNTTIVKVNPNNKYWQLGKDVYSFGELWVKLKDRFKINTQTKNSSIVSQEESKIISNEKDQQSLASEIEGSEYIELFKKFINENEGSLNESIWMKISWMKAYKFLLANIKIN